MKLSRREMLVAGAAVPAAALAARAQDPVVPVPPSPAAPAPVPAPVAEDPLLATGLLLAGRKQIDVSLWAAERAHSADVKEFALAEVREHRDLKQRLRELGFRLSVETARAAAAAAAPPAGFAPGAPRDDTAPPGTPVPAAAPKGTLPPPRPVAVGDVVLGADASALVRIEDETATEYIRLIERELGRLSGRDFDRAYVGQQLGEHYALLGRALVSKRHASRAMLALLNDAQPVIERHIGTLVRLVGRPEPVRGSER
jgi:predicted outer membrane protein